MKKLLSVLSLSLIVINLLAVPAKPIVLEHQQADGSVIEYRLRGDEFLKYKTTTDDYLIIQNSSGDYEYAKLADNGILSTGVRVSALSVRTEEEISFLSTMSTLETQIAQIKSLKAARVAAKKRSTRTAVAAPKGLVILVNFSDITFNSNTANGDFNNLLNQTNYSANGATGSANDYFKSVSNGVYDPEFDVYGPYTLDHSMSYYGANDVYTDEDALPAQMVLDAMNKLMSDQSVNINLNDYDSDNDGVLNDIFVFYAGHNEAEGAEANTVWPHAWEVADYNTTGNRVFQGKELKGYACTSELRGYEGATMSGIGTFCHEFSHVLGLPDIYATDYSDHKTSGDWDIMDMGSYLNDGNTPPAYSAYERFFMGWMTPTMLNAAGHYTLNNIIDSNSAYLISSTGDHNLDGDDPNPTEFYLLENRKLEGWDTYLPGAGMIITRIRYRESSWIDNTVNNTDWYMGIDIIEADGKAPDYDPYDYTFAYYGKPGDAFPGSDNVRRYTPYDDYPITDIQLTNDVISFDFMGGEQLFTVNFSANTFGTCAVESLTESAVGSGIVLPNVTVAADSIDFEGWATTRTLQVADAGDAGETYFPRANITLYALFSIDGEIVDGNKPSGDCLLETFDGLSGMNSSTDISNKIGDLADNEGWTGVKLFPYNESVKIGSNSKKGSITTPILNISGDVEVKIRVMGKSATKLNVSLDGVAVHELDITSRFEEYVFTVPGLNASSTLTIKAGINVYYIDNIEICAMNSLPTGNEESEEKKAMIIDSSVLVGVEKGDVINCYDMTGKLAWTRVAMSTSMDIDTPQGLYVITITNESGVEVLKGIK